MPYRKSEDKSNTVTPRYWD